MTGEETHQKQLMSKITRIIRHDHGETDNVSVGSNSAESGTERTKERKVIGHRLHGKRVHITLLVPSTEWNAALRSRWTYLSYMTHIYKGTPQGDEMPHADKDAASRDHSTEYVLSRLWRGRKGRGLRCECNKPTTSQRL